MRSQWCVQLCKPFKSTLSCSCVSAHVAQAHLAHEKWLLSVLVPEMMIDVYLRLPTPVTRRTWLACEYLVRAAVHFILGGSTRQQNR